MKDDVLNMLQSIFAWNKTNEHTSLTSQKALQPQDIDLHAKQNKYLPLNNNVGEEIVDVLHDGMESVCDLDPSIADLQILELKAKLSEAQNKLKRSLFRLEHVKNDDSLVHRRRKRGAGGLKPPHF